MHVETGLLFLRMLAVVPGLVGSASIETRGGIAPVQVSEDSVPSVATVLNTAFGVKLLSERLQITLTYGPQLIFRRPNLADRWRPLLIHQGLLSSRWLATRTTTLNSLLSGSAGEADYLALRQLIGMQQAALPNSIDLVTGRAEVGVQVMTSPHNRWRASTFGQRLQPLGGTIDPAVSAGVFTFPRQTQIGVGSDYTHAVDRKTTLGGSLETLYLHHTAMATNEYLIVTPKFLATHTTAPSALWAGGLGASWVQTIGNSGTHLQELVPAADFSVESRVLARRHALVSAGATTRLAWVLDPILGNGVPVVIVNLFARGNFTPRWTATPSASFSTSVSGSPRMGEPNETLVSAQFPIGYRVQSNLILEFGGRFFQSAPHFEASRFRFSQREVWAYFAIRTNFDSTTPPTR